MKPLKIRSKKQLGKSLNKRKKKDLIKTEREVDLLKETRPQSLNDDPSSFSEREMSSNNYPINRAKFGMKNFFMTKREYFGN
jgi:hypothetical protein